MKKSSDIIISFSSLYLEMQSLCKFYPKYWSNTHRTRSHHIQTIFPDNLSFSSLHDHLFFGHKNDFQLLCRLCNPSSFLKKKFQMLQDLVNWSISNIVFFSILLEICFYCKFYVKSVKAS